jgi:FkbM family methyltransferase
MGRAKTLARRALAARRFGFLFLGTSRLRMPSVIRLENKSVELVSPQEHSLTSDIVNIWLDDEYGIRALRNIHTVVDVGANIGLFTIFARDVFPDAAIHAYEPNARVFPFLTANAGTLRAECFNEAVGSSEGRVEMCDVGDSRLAKVTAVETGGVSRIGIEQVVDRMNGHIDLLKMDCEGSEWEILRDAEALGRVDNIRMEYHLGPGQTCDELRRLSEAAGFRIESLRANRTWGIAWLVR